MSTQDQKTLLEQQLAELMRVGVGGKFKSNNTEDYTNKITAELEHEEAMIRGGINRYQKLIREAVKDNQESTTLYGIVYQQKYITKLSELINQEIIAHTSYLFNEILCACHHNLIIDLLL